MTIGSGIVGHASFAVKSGKESGFAKLITHPPHSFSNPSESLLEAYWIAIHSSELKLSTFLTFDFGRVPFDFLFDTRFLDVLFVATFDLFSGDVKIVAWRFLRFLLVLLNVLQGIWRWRGGILWSRCAWLVNGSFSYTINFRYTCSSISTTILLRPR